MNQTIKWRVSWSYKVLGSEEPITRGVVTVDAPPDGLKQAKGLGLIKAMRKLDLKSGSELAKLIHISSCKPKAQKYRRAKAKS